MEISHTIAFCPLRVAHLRSPRGPRGTEAHWKQRDSVRDLEKSPWLASCHRASDDASSRLSPWTWPHRSLSLCLTHTWFTVKSSGCQKVWTVHFLIQTNAAVHIMELSWSHKVFQTTHKCWVLIWWRARARKRQRFMVPGGEAVER